MFALLHLALAIAADPLVVTSSGVARGGAQITAIAAPDSPWAVVLLVADVPDGRLDPRERALLGSLARALAWGKSGLSPAGLDLTAIGGISKARADADSIAISLGAPSAQIDELLRAMELRIRNRKSLAPADGPIASLDVDVPAIDAQALALAAPGTPDALAVDAPVGEIDARALREIADVVLSAARTRIVVVGPRPAPELLAAAQRMFASPLIASADPAPQASTLSEGTRVAESVDALAEGVRSTLWLVCPEDVTASSHVLAALAGGRAQRASSRWAVVVEAKADRPSRAPVAEGKVLARFDGLASTLPPDEVVARARDQARADRLSKLKDPEALAWAVARSKTSVDDEVAALSAVTPADVQKAARACVLGPRVIVRRLGARR